MRHTWDKNNKTVKESWKQVWKNKCRSFVFTSGSTVPENRHSVHVVVHHAVTAKKCTKRRDARAELLFCQSKSIVFDCNGKEMYKKAWCTCRVVVLPFSLTSPSSLLKLPIVHQSSYFITPHLSLRFNFCSLVVAALTKKWNESFSFCCLILFTLFLSSNIFLFSFGPLVINRYINSCKNSYLSKSLHQSPVLVHWVMWHHSHFLLWFHSPPWSWNHECLDKENKVVWILSSRRNSLKLWFSLSSDSLDVKFKKFHVSGL